MPSLLVRLLLTVLSLYASHCWASTPDDIVLDDSRPSLVVKTDIRSWVDEGSHATIDHVATGNAATFKDGPALERFSLNKYDSVWIKLRVQRTAGSTAQWTLNLPLPSVDIVALYQLDENGGWTVQRAGDNLSQSDWPKPGLYPDFDLRLRGSAPQDLYLQVRNFKALSIPIRLVVAQQRESQRQAESLGMGLMLGALLSLAALSLLRYIEHRNPIDAGAAWFGLLIAATIGQVTGVMNAFVWAPAPEIGNYAFGVMPVVAVGCALLFLRHVFVLRVPHPRFDRFLSSAGWGTLASVLVFAMMDRFVADRVTAMVMLIAITVGMLAAFLSWRQGSTAGRWLLFTLLPQLFGVLYMIGEFIGIVPAMWELSYLMALGVAITVPVLMYTLSQITHDRKELVVRAKHLPTQDALTGLLTAEVFQTHLEAAVQRAIDNREAIALVAVRITNYEHIRQAYSDTTGEQCLLRAVVKLQRILRDVDPAGRVGPAQFALLMEGVTNRQALTERMVKLIASGLIPLPGLVPEVTLHFQAACVLLHENPVPAERVLDDLRDLLAGMSSNTRRPIRFLDAPPTQAAVLRPQADAE